MSVWVDGVRVFDSASSEVAGGAVVDPRNVNAFTVDQIEGIEVYRAPAETPSDYGGTNAMCGTVAIRTRVGR